MKSSSLLKSLIREVIDVRTEYDKKVESIYDAYRRVGDLGNLELDSPVFYETVAEKIADVFKIFFLEILMLFLLELQSLKF